MKPSRIAKRSIYIGDRKTSVSMENDFWTALKEIAGKRRISELVSSINDSREYGNLSSAVRLFVLNHYRMQREPMIFEEAKKYILYLDALRACGETNMFGAGSYLREEFGLTRDESHKVLSAWMKSDRTKSLADRAEAFVNYPATTKEKIP
jgi:predicted DNA-binding ribbon-helix-helix protein